jgi:hypothetical protein
MLAIPALTASGPTLDGSSIAPDWLARFLFAHPNGELQASGAWADGQRELAGAEALRAQIRCQVAVPSCGAKLRCRVAVPSAVPLA